MKQPALGIVSTVLVIAVSMGFISVFTLPVFTSWVAFLMICLIPMLVVMSVTWGGKLPAFAARRPQPARGLLFLSLAAGAGVPVAAIHLIVVGGAITPPVPMLSMCIVTTVIMAFWLAIIWGGWPFSRMQRHPVAAGLVMLAAAYVLNYLLYRLFFDFSFLRGAPVYAAALDPHGLFNAWDAQVAAVTVISAMFLVLCFEQWPFTRVPALMRQPLLGITWTVLVLAIGAAAIGIAAHIYPANLPSFMVQVPIPFVFGTIIVMNMLQNSLFAKVAQPLKGVLNSAVAAVVGVALARLFGALEPRLSGHAQPGPPAYSFEVWLASALLAVTFPFLVIFAELFQFWPLSGRSRSGRPHARTSQIPGAS